MQTPTPIFVSPGPFNLPGKLRSQGLAVSPNGVTTTFSPVFLVGGYSLNLNQENMVYYEFPDSEAVKAIYISAEGATFRNRSGAFISYSPVKIGPHVYIKDNLLVLYIGDDSTILNALKAVLGTQIAGV